VREDLTDELRKGLIVHYVEEMDEVLALALTPAGQAARQGRFARMSDMAN
jgi:hypothetical protein